MYRCKKVMNLSEVLLLPVGDKKGPRIATSKSDQRQVR